MTIDKAGAWDVATLDTLERWDPEWTAACVTMSTNPWTSGILSRKLVELISLGLNVACTNLNPDGTRRHTRAALEAGATRDEILFVIKAGALMSVHALATGAPILAEEAKAAGVKPVPRSNAVPTPACDAMKAMGQWNNVWDPLVALDPTWFDEFMAAAAETYKTCPLPPKELELLSIACDASYTHMYAPGTHRHIKRAFEAGATMEEVVEVLKLCVVQGVQSCNLGVPILEDEVEKGSAPIP
jgi:alkylhydroperoxidase/carboxymuconolactone decarboxylase family protein YurZ